ncbi:MAG: tRNA uridine-5-carboxymethylaminomethyl(34) synthesis GTPase MnmE [Candidatus Binatia bacterium]
MYADDTIAAVATPPGPGGVGIIRVSGPLSSAIAGRVFSTARESSGWTSHHLYHGHVLDADGGVLDEGLAVLMRRPRSYTGEDVLELHCHGAPVLLQRILAYVLRCGARLAEPGEFTKRAFLNGRIDLMQAEAVLDLVRARTTAGAAIAAEQLDGRLSAHLGGLRSQLVVLKALLETQIDFCEEDIMVCAEQLLSAADHCIVTIQDLINTFSHGKWLREGLRVAIIGKPNVGKSSLLNALLGEERAIVTPIAGTTRDSIVETVDFEGVPVVLTDTAGLREPAQVGAVERLGIARTTAKIAASEVLLAVFDASAPLDREDDAVLKAAAGSPHIIVLNKTDLPRGISEDELRRGSAGGPMVAVSAKERLGLGALRRAVVAQVGGGNGSDPSGPVLTNIRHRDALEKARNSLLLARESISEARPADLIAVDVQDAIDHIGEVTGGITSEEVLDQIFSKFCIGK